MKFVIFCKIHGIIIYTKKIEGKKECYRCKIMENIRKNKKKIIDCIT